MPHYPLPQFLIRLHPPISTPHAARIFFAASAHCRETDATARAFCASSLPLFFARKIIIHFFLVFSVAVENRYRVSPNNFLMRWTPSAIWSVPARPMSNVRRVAVVKGSFGVPRQCRWRSSPRCTPCWIRKGEAGRRTFPEATGNRRSRPPSPYPINFQVAIPEHGERPRPRSKV